MLIKKIFLIILAVFSIMPLFVYPQSAKGATTSVGASQTFTISKDYSFNGQSKLNATLRVMGDKSQYFVDDEYWNAKTFSEQQEILQQIGKLADEFDNRIYPLETNFWGSEWSPGIDNDPKIAILLANLVDNAGGYYDTGNEYLKARVPESNEKDMIYLNIRTLRSENRVYSFLAHEFQHLIAFNQKYLLRRANDDVWVNELRSEYSITLLGYNDVYTGSNLKRRVTAFLDEPSDSLMEWTNKAADYGQIDLFGEYLVDHFGADILKKSLHSDLSNIDSLNQALRDNNFNLDFKDVFLRWAVANTLNDILFDTNYGYFRDGLRQDFNIPATRLIRGVSEYSNFSLTEAFKDWQSKWIWITDLARGNKNILKVNFSGEKKEFFRVAAIIFYRDGGRQVNFFDFSNPSTGDLLFDLGRDLEKIILIPIKMEKVSGFTDQEALSDLTISLERLAVFPSTAPTPIPSIMSTPWPITTQQLPKIVRPADFGLREGDFIRAEGDIDIFIINDLGFKRLVLNPKICLLYGHLGGRGCFSSVKIVSPQVRDAFKTSFFFTDGENKDGRVYFLELTGGDSAVLHFVNMSGEKFMEQGGNFSAVFLINTREKNIYHIGAELKDLQTMNLGL